MMCFQIQETWNVGFLARIVLPAVPSVQIVNISSTMGSISSALNYLKEGLNPMSKMQLGYRASKSALNMGMRLVPDTFYYCHDLFLQRGTLPWSHSV